MDHDNRFSLEDISKSLPDVSPRPLQIRPTRSDDFSFQVTTPTHEDSEMYSRGDEPASDHDGSYPSFFVSPGLLSKSMSLTRVSSMDSILAMPGSPASTFSGAESSFAEPSSAHIQSLLVMRHSERLDDVDQSWAATNERPWDPPLTQRGTEFAFEVGQKLRKDNWGVSRIVSSPYLRCVETAAQVAIALAANHLPAAGKPGNLDLNPGAVRVSIDYGLSEMMNSIGMRSTLMMTLPQIRAASWIYPISHLKTLIPAILLDNDYVPVYPEMISYGESEEAAHARFIHTFDAIADKYPQENVLCITHGEGVSVSVTRFVPVTVYEVKYCALSCCQRRIYDNADEEEEEKHNSDWEPLTENGPTGITWMV